MKYWWLSIRPKTLTASVGPVLLVSSLADINGYFDIHLALAILICALFLQISVNLANDYFDAKSGVDTDQRVGPTRMTQTGALSPEQVFRATIATTSVAVASGLYLVFHSDWRILIAGIASVIATFLYSGGPKPLASIGLGEVTVFIFFGLLSVAGGYYVFAGEIEVSVWWFASAVGALSAAIMLVNNIRDRETDAAASKLTLVVKIGELSARRLYVSLIIFAALAHLLATRHMGWVTMLVPLAICGRSAGSCAYGLLKHDGAALNQWLAKTAQLLFLYCLSLSLTLILQLYFG